MKRSFDREKFIERFEAMDKVLVASGFPPISPWWLGEIKRFVRSGRRRWVDRVGRRGGKSTSLCRLAVAWALWGGWHVPVGDRGVISFVSVDVDEAGSRIFTISKILDALGVEYKRRGNYEIELIEPNVFFWVVTCSLTGTVGHTSIAIFCDEVAKWESRETAANPAKEVMGSLRPTLATQPLGFEVSSSSPWSEEDYHAELFDAGDNEHQIVSYAPTWEANPTISEEDTRAFEPDEREWLRAYKAIPGGTVIEGWFAGSEDSGFVVGNFPPMMPGIKPVFAIDPAFGHNDFFGWAVLTSEVDVQHGVGRRITRVRDSGSWDPTNLKPSELAHRLRTEVIDRWVSVPKGTPVHVFSDQYEGKSFNEICHQNGILLEVVPWTTEGRDGAWRKGPPKQEGKLSRFKSVRTALREGTFKFRSAVLKRQFGKVKGVLSPSGRERITFPTRNDTDGHLDELSAVVLGGSIVLERQPNTAESLPLSRDQRERIQMKKVKQELCAKMEKKRRRRWHQNPRAVMREIVFRQ